MSSLTHGSMMEDMSSDLRSVLLLGPKPRPPIGGLYHPNARQRQAAEAGARRIRVQKLLRIHESRKAVLQLERGLQASRASLLAMEEEAGEDGVQTLAMFKSPAVPAMLKRKRQLRDALADVEAASAAARAQGPAAKRHHLEVSDELAAERHRIDNDANAKRHRCEAHDDVAAKRHRAEALDNVNTRRRRREDEDDVREVRRRLDGDGVGVVLRHKRLAALQAEELDRQRAEVLQEDVRRSKTYASARDEAYSRHRAERHQDEALGRRQAGHDQEGRWHRSERAQDDALYRRRVETLQEDGLHRHRRSEAEEALRRQHRQRYRVEAREKVEATDSYHHVVRELQEVQQKRAAAAEPTIQVTASSASPPALPKKLLLDEDVSPMMMAWCSKPGFEPTTPTDFIPSPLFMRGPRGVRDASPDRLCRSPTAMCRSPCAR